MGVEIERKFLIKNISDIPLELSKYSFHSIEQGYICTDPVIRVRRRDDEYILTVKGEGLLSREEHELPLTEESYNTLRDKADGIIINKRRYIIPLPDAMLGEPLDSELSTLKVELDIFGGLHQGLIIAEIEFPSEEAATGFTPPEWMSQDVTMDTRYHNSNLSKSRP